MDTARGCHGRNYGNRHSEDARQNAGASPISNKYIVSYRQTACRFDRLQSGIGDATPDGTLGDVSVAVADALAADLGVPVEFKPYDNPARYNESLATDDWESGLLRAIPLVQSTSPSA